MKKYITAALSHWKTSTAGIAAGVLVVAQSYQAGMTWKQWALAGALALFGLSSSDGNKTLPAPKPL
jgi:hypothetical protein